MKTLILTLEKKSTETAFVIPNKKFLYFMSFTIFPVLLSVFWGSYMRKLKGSGGKHMTDVHIKELKILKAIIQGQLLYKKRKLMGKAHF